MSLEVDGEQCRHVMIGTGRERERRGEGVL